MTSYNPYKVLALVFLGWILVVLIDFLFVPLLFNGAGRETSLHLVAPSMLLYAVGLGLFIPLLSQGKSFLRLASMFSVSVTSSSLIVAAFFI